MTRACLSLLPFTLLFALACNPVIISGSSSNPDQGGSPATSGGSETSGSTTPVTPPGPPQIQANNIAAPKGDVLEIALGNYLESCGPSAFDHYPENATPSVVQVAATATVAARAARGGSSRRRG